MIMYKFPEVNLFDNGESGLNINHLYMSLLLAIITYTIYRLLSSKQSQSKTILLRTYKHAVDILKEDTYFPWNQSRSNGATNGILSFITRDVADERFYQTLKQARDDTDAENIMVSYFKNSPNLFNRNNNPEHFSNHFLCRLSERDLNLFRKIVMEGRGIKLVMGAITLYRRDTRNCDTIFTEGFKLRERENTIAGSKYQATEPVTYGKGISTSDTIPPAGYGNRGYYTIKIPKNHSLAIIDIVNSVKNKDRLTQYQKDLREFN